MILTVLPTQVAQKGTLKGPYTSTECPPSTIHYQETPICAGRLALGRTEEVRAPLFTISGLLVTPEMRAVLAMITCTAWGALAPGSRGPKLAMPVPDFQAPRRLNATCDLGS